MDRMADEGRRDLASELERETRCLRSEVATAQKVIIALFALLVFTVMWAAQIYSEGNLKAHVAAYEIADRCTRECDCSHIGLDR